MTTIVHGGRAALFQHYDFDDQALVDDEIDSVSGRQLVSLITQWQPDLVLKLQAGLRQLVAESSVVRAFDDACTQRAMNLHRSTDDVVADFIRTHDHLSLCVLCSPLCPRCTPKRASGVKQSRGHR